MLLDTKLLNDICLIVIWSCKSEGDSGMTFRKHLKKIAKPDWCKWGLAHRGDRWSTNKCYFVRLKVFMGLLHYTEELHRRLVRDESVDSTNKVVGSIMMSAMSLEVKDYDISLSIYFQELIEKFIDVWPKRVLRRMRPCVDANTSIVPQSKSRCENCNGGEFECSMDNDEFKHIDIQIQRRSERHGWTSRFEDSNVNKLVTAE